MTRRRGAIAVGLLLGLTTMAPVPATADHGDGSVGHASFPFQEPLQQRVRSLESKANISYALSVWMPRDGQLLTQIGCTIPSGSTMDGVLSVVLEPFRGFGGSLGVTGSPGSTHTYSSASGTPVEFGEERTWNLGEGGFGGVSSLLTGRGGLGDERVTFIWFCTSDVGASGMKINVSKTKNVKVIAESWGRGVGKLLTDKDFADGARISGGGRVEIPMTGGLGLGPDAVVSVARNRQVRFKRSATAIFMPGNTHATGYLGVGTASYNNLFSVRSPEPPWYYTHRGWTQTEDQDRYYGAGGTFFAGLMPGTYDFSIHAFAGATPNYPLLGAEQYVRLVTVDGDVPPCSRSKIAWREPDGHRVCGPGPARMLRGLQP